MSASKVELPPVRGAGYEPVIVILSQSQGRPAHLMELVLCEEWLLRSC